MLILIINNRLVRNLTNFYQQNSVGKNVYCPSTRPRDGGGINHSNVIRPPASRLVERDVRSLSSADLRYRSKEFYQL